MAPGSDIEDQFVGAVKSALEMSGSVGAPTIAATVPVRVGRPKRRLWGIALLCMAFAAITAVIVAAALHVRHNNLARLNAEMAARRPAGTSDQPNATIGAPGSTAATESTAITSGLTSTTASEAPTPGIRASTAAASGAPAATSTASSARMSPAAEGPTAAALAPTAEASSTSASTASTASELQQPLATPSVLPRRPQVQRQTRPPAASSKQFSASAHTGHRAMATVVAPVHGLESAFAEPLANAQASLSERANGAYSTRRAESQPSAGRVSSTSPTLAAIPSEVTPAVRATVGSAGAPSGSSVATRFVLVSPADHSVYWALEDSGTMFRSTDQKSWQKQDTGVQSDLLAGHAVSNSVCWVVGRNGTILLTTDGTRWQRIKSPTSTDLVSVSAVSADVADINAADGSGFSTFDRGSNWQPSK